MKKLFKGVLYIIIIVLGVVGMVRAANRPTASSELSVNKNFDDILVLVNREHSLGKNYEPSDLMKPDVRFFSNMTREEKLMRREAGEALEELFKAAENDGINLYALSGYRSYKTQKKTYEERVERQGQQLADSFVARPGYSEHNTGLSMDITNKDFSTSFETTAEGIWLKDNCYKFGFIIRYPKGKEDITGYSYEPWHIRYVGKVVAETISTQNITLEEYLNK
ncbi:MAG: M15 family metallopeptidase [Clostridium argentinense]|uniref:M15 family metallopeptidase n=1 Tax=Clostridium faecium TaxID=2762223 RepID=A0ABR8YV05_9CLOT|nr:MULTISPECIES: M15 family metallopeptidase [Clostridium]MBD8048060.1 M15 family metallopeptidase [Clostridium faecium]MBS5822489.1 M15 family metallopeptidase [Clostridium argentinense]MDU1350105.1 M15 family metallopeptidase [Clostridium argentinense]